MAGFVNLRIPLMVRRGLTMISALIIIAAGMYLTEALVLSQVVLSFGIPFALVPLVMLTCRRDVMGAQVNRRVTTILAWSCAVMIVGMNIFLICRSSSSTEGPPPDRIRRAGRYLLAKAASAEA